MPPIDFVMPPFDHFWQHSELPLLIQSIREAWRPQAAVSVEKAL